MRDDFGFYILDEISYTYPSVYPSRAGGTFSGPEYESYYE